MAGGRRLNKGAAVTVHRLQSARRPLLVYPGELLSQPTVRETLASCGRLKAEAWQPRDTTRQRGDTLGLDANSAPFGVGGEVTLLGSRATEGGHSTGV